MITLQEIKQNESIKALVRAGNRYLETLGYTDHGPRHLGYVSRTASGILKSLGYSEREVELAAIAGWVHDVGNSVNRHDHGPNGAILLFPLLREIGMDIEDVMIIITAVGNHEEQSGTVSSAVSAALAIADKSDAHKSRVRNGRPDVGDIHDRVNFAIQENSAIVDRKHLPAPHPDVREGGRVSGPAFRAVYQRPPGQQPRGRVSVPPPKGGISHDL